MVSFALFEFLLCFGFAAVSVRAQSEPFTLVQLNEASNGAMCLDGSSVSYYIRYGTDVNKWLLYLEGNGYCSLNVSVYSTASFDYCYDRSFTSLGSTVNDATTMTLNEAYFSTDKNVNPLLYDATMVYM